MNLLTADIGSTYTKLTAIDVKNRTIVATSSAFTTIETDIMEGFETAYEKVKWAAKGFCYDELYCCSSAAGGLKMVALGLVPELTSKAAELAAASAGAKVVKTYAFEISQAEQNEIDETEPDIVLLCGGTDGGNSEVIIANAKRLVEIDKPFRVIVAGNKSSSFELKRIFAAAGKQYYIVENVMPRFGQLNIEPAKEKIKEIFVNHIIEAKGLNRIRKLCSADIIPTPLAVLRACELLSKGSKEIVGIGDLMAIDIGGATTDVYSIAEGKPAGSNIIIKGVPEPVSKRSVEGDLGMRYSLKSLAGKLNLNAIAEMLNVEMLDIDNQIERSVEHPDMVTLPLSMEQKIEEQLAYSAVKLATERHVGRWQSVYTPLGEMMTLRGKDLSAIPTVIGIGGVIVNSEQPINILKAAEQLKGEMIFAKPTNPNYFVDEGYIFSSMGLLCNLLPNMTLEILKRGIKKV